MLAAQKINVGIVFHNMLSAEEANHYMAKNGIPEAVATRVLDHARHRRKNDVHPRLVDQPHGDNGG